MDNRPDCHFRNIISLVIRFHAQFLRRFIGIAVRDNAPDRRVAVQLVNIHVIILPREIFHAAAVWVAAVGRVLLPVLRAIDDDGRREVMRVNHALPCQELRALAAFRVKIYFI